MRTITSVEAGVVVGGDPDGNETACETAVAAGAGLASATFGIPGAAVASTLIPGGNAACVALTTAAGVAIASGIAGAAEGVDAFSNSLSSAIGALQMAAMRAHASWLMVDGL